MRLKELIDVIDDLICINPDTFKIYYEHSITLITQSLKRLAQKNKSDGDGSIFVMPTIDILKGAEMILDQSIIDILLNMPLSTLVINDSQPLSLFESSIFPVFYVSKTTTTDRIFAQFCIHYSNSPRDSIDQMIGVTGTNGKTTVTHMIEKVLSDAKLTVGLIGTLGYRCCGHENNYIKTDWTTPDAWSLQTILNEMKTKYHIGNVVLEVSSHGLAVDRVYGCDFTVAIFTNLTQEHLRFHKTMENYLQSKLLLFSKYLSKSLSPKAIINHDDPSYEQFLNVCPSNAEVYTYGLSKKNQNSFVAYHIKHSLYGTSYTVLLPSGQIRRVHLNIHGDFNVYNSLACIATCSTTYSHLLTLDQIIQSLETFQCVKGRFQFHIIHRPFSVVVDFAHTIDGLEQVIKTGREILLESAENGRLIVVFGSSGRGERSQRPLFGRIADEYSDIMIVTSENPFQENPQNIIDEIVSGIQQKPDKNRLYIELDRKKAIHLAMDMAKGTNDLIIIPGQGHETVQIFADHAIEFNEKEIIEEKYLQMMQDNNSSIEILK